MDKITSIRKVIMIPHFPFHKGEWCKRINSTCQEGTCHTCEAYVRPMERDHNK